MAGSTMAASRPTIASTQTTSISAKPSASAVSTLAARDIGCRTCSAGLTIRTERHDLVGVAVSWRAIEIGVIPRVAGHRAALQIRTVPCVSISGALNQRAKTLVCGGVSTDIEEKQVKRAGKAIDLDSRRFRFGFAEIVQDARSNQ